MADLTAATGKTARTRERLLEAALDLLPGALRAGLEQSLGPVAVSGRAGVSRQTWYRHWGADGDSFVEDLVEYLLPISRGIAGVMSDGAARVERRGDELGVEEATELASLAFYVSADPRFVLTRHIVFALATEERIVAEREGREVEGGATELVRAYFDRYTDTLAGAYAVILDSWGREPAPPFDLRSLSVVLTAMAAGISFRRCVDPEAVPDNLGADAILLLAPTLTRVKAGSSDSGPADLFGDDVMRSERAPSAQREAGRRRVERSQASIIQAARREFAMRGYEGTSMATVARAAGMSESTVYEHFWSKSGLVRACYEAEYRDLARAVETDPADPLARIHGHVVRLAGLFGAYPALASGVLDGLARMDEIGRNLDGNPRMASPFPLALVGPIREAKEAGTVRTDIRSMDIAIAITNLVLVHGRIQPRESAEGVARHVERVILGGVLTDAGRRSLPDDGA